MTPPRYLTIGIILFMVSSFSCSKKEVKPPPFEPRSAYIRASQLMEEEEFEQARELLMEVKNRDASKEYAPLAQLKIADSFLKEGEFDLAIEEHRRFLEFYPHNQYAPFAQYQIGMIYFQQIESADRGYKSAEDAIREFKKLNELFPRNPYREIIPVRIQKCRNILAAHEYYVGEFYYKKEAYLSALGRLHTLINEYHEYKEMPKVYFLIAMSYKGLGEVGKAEEFFLKTIESSTDRDLIKRSEKEIGSLKK